jgi:hypothetical protein
MDLSLDGEGYCMFSSWCLLLRLVEIRDVPEHTGIVHHFLGIYHLGQIHGFSGGEVACACGGPQTGVSQQSGRCGSIDGIVLDTKK